MHPNIHPDTGGYVSAAAWTADEHDDGMGTSDVMFAAVGAAIIDSVDGGAPYAQDALDGYVRHAVRCGYDKSVTDALGALVDDRAAFRVLAIAYGRAVAHG